MTGDVEKMTLDECPECRPVSKCSCGGWLILAGSSYVGPTSFLIRRKCVGCGDWVVTENTRRTHRRYNRQGSYGECGHGRIPNDSLSS